MRLAERVPAGDEGDGLLVVHGHPPERLADVDGRGQRVRVAVGALRVHVDEAHLDGGQRVGELAVAAVALVIEPGVLRAPVDVLGLPGVLAPAAEAERREPHRLQGAVAGEDHEVGPGDLAAVLLLDRPQQPARLVEVRVVRPAVERREALRGRARAAATVADPVGAGAVPRHADEQRAVVAVVGRPPLLRVRHQGHEVAPDGLEVERGELGGVVEVRPHRVDGR